MRLAEDRRKPWSYARKRLFVFSSLNTPSQRAPPRVCRILCDYRLYTSMSQIISEDSVRLHSLHWLGRKREQPLPMEMRAGTTRTTEYSRDSSGALWTVSSQTLLSSSGHMKTEIEVWDRTLHFSHKWASPLYTVQAEGTGLPKWLRICTLTAPGLLT